MIPGNRITRGFGRGGTVNLDAPSDRFEELIDPLRATMRRAWVPGATATHLHAIAPIQAPAAGGRLNLFHAPCPMWGRVAEVKRETGAKVGRFAPRSGATLHANKFHPDPSNLHDICDARGEVCF